MTHWLWLGLCCFLSAPSLIFFERHEFMKKEPFYASPVALVSDKVLLRNDKFGKGAFGASRGNVRHSRTHTGIDLTAAIGSPVTASKSGRVFFAGDDPTGYGHYVEIHHPDGLLTRYAHLTQILAREGEWIKQNEPIGTCGKSGNANGSGIIPHLHFEIRYKNQPLNPGSGLLDPRVRIQ